MTKMMLCCVAVIMTIHSLSITEVRSQNLGSENRPSAVRIVAEPTGRSGTGCFTWSTSDSDCTLVLTNRHLVEGASHINVVFLLTDSARNIRDTCTRRVSLHDENLDSTFKVSNDHDIAIIRAPGPYGRPSADHSWAIPRSGFARLTDLEEGMRVVFIGYPLGLTVNGIEPLSRLGMIAGVDTLQNLILLDAQSFGGSSGSPVYVTGDWTNRPSPAFAGIISGYRPFTKKLVNIQTGDVEMVQTENSGIAVVMPAERILALIQDLETDFGSEQKSDNLE